MTPLILPLYPVGDYIQYLAADPANAREARTAVLGIIGRGEAPAWAWIYQCVPAGHIWADTADAPGCPWCGETRQPAPLR